MYGNFERIIKERGITPYKVAKDTQIATSTFYDWKSGRYVPKIDKLKKISDYLQIPVEKLLEEETGKECLIEK